MTAKALKTELKDIQSLRALFLQETNFQIRYDACHERGWTDSYIFIYNNEKIGYGSIKGNGNLNDRDTVFEFYLTPSFRNQSSIVLIAIQNKIFYENFFQNKSRNETIYESFF